MVTTGKAMRTTVIHYASFWHSPGSLWLFNIFISENEILSELAEMYKCN